jgi:hypothetical protein
MLLTYHTGDPARTIWTGAKQHAGGKTCDHQFKTKLAQNVSPNPITKISPPRRRAPKTGVLTQA